MADFIPYLFNILDRNKINAELNPVFTFNKEPFQNGQPAELIKEVYEDLSGSVTPPLKPRLPDLQIDNTYLVLDEAINFNRYRMTTFRSEFYDTSELPLQQLRTLCRNEERECLKVGVKESVWTSSFSEHHFGKSEGPGDLGLNGSAGWKLIAYKDFLLDLITQQNKTKLVRLSIYDRLMINKKLVPLKELLMKRSEENEKALFYYLARKLGIDFEREVKPEAEDPTADIFPLKR